MNARAIVSTVLATTLALGAASSFARDRHERDDRRERREAREQQREIRTQQREFAQQQRHWAQQQRHPFAPDYRAHGRSHYGPTYYGPPAGYAPATTYAPRHFGRGDYVPWEYRRHWTPVNNWGAYNLYAPPVGHQWVQNDSGDYLLMALATGLIANLFMR